MTNKQNTRLITLTQGKYAVVDEDDYEKLSKHKWFATKDKKTFYARRMMVGAQGRRMVMMHRVILNYYGKMQIDHINGNGLDNRKENIRICTPSQNQRNRNKSANKTSIYKGVSRTKYGTWHAYFRYNGKQINLGAYNKEEDAAQKHNTIAILLWGKYAKLNAIEAARAAGKGK